MPKFASNLNTYKVITYMYKSRGELYLNYFCLFYESKWKCLNNYKKFINSKLQSLPKPSPNLKFCFIKIAHRETYIHCFWFAPHPQGWRLPEPLRRGKALFYKFPLPQIHTHSIRIWYISFHNDKGLWLNLDYRFKSWWYRKKTKFPIHTMNTDFIRIRLVRS